MSQRHWQRTRHGRGGGAGGASRHDAPSRGSHDGQGERGQDHDTGWSREPEPPVAAKRPLRDVTPPPARSPLPIGWRVLLWVAGLGVAVYLGTQAVITLGPGERGVLTTMGKVEPEVLGEGMHFVVPLVQTVVRANVGTGSATREVEVLTKDRLPLKLRLTAQYRLDSRELPNVLRDMGFADVGDKVLQPALQAVPELIFQQRIAQAALADRAAMTEMLKQAVSDRVQKKGVRVEQFDVVWSPPPATLDAVSAAESAARRAQEESAAAALANKLAAEKAAAPAKPTAPVVARPTAPPAVAAKASP